MAIVVAALRRGVNAAGRQWTATPILALAKAAATLAKQSE